MNEIKRLIAAFGYSFEGLKAACRQPAFRIELFIACIALPLACFAGKTGIERALLIGSLLLVLIVELLNSAIEATVDRISTERHALSKRAKDIASAAVFISIINAGFIWLAVIGDR